MATPLVIGPDQIAAFTALSKYAEQHVVDMPKLMKEIETPDGKAAHKKAMTAQTVELPFGFMVTYSVEAGHPSGLCRHMSMSSPVNGRAPTEHAVWMVAEYFGFKGGLQACYIWQEDLERGPNGQHNVAINIVQPMRTN